MKKIIKLKHGIICFMFACLFAFITGCTKDQKTEYSLTMNIQPIGSGTVTLTPSGGKYPEGTQVTLTPIAGSNYSFIAWSGADASNVDNNKIVMSKDMIIIANFGLSTYSINASVTPLNSGTVSGTGTYTVGQTVTLTAIPALGYTFTNWTENGTQVSTNTTYSFSANSDRTLVANLALTEYTIAASVNPANSGTIVGAGTYYYGQTVSVIVTPVSGYSFVNWTENGAQVSTDATYSFTANSDHNLVANLELSTKIRLKSGSGLNSGANIYFAALSKNVNYFNFTVDEMFAYNKTEADWYIDGGVIPFTTDYKKFDLNPGDYYFLLSGSSTVVITTVTITSGMHTFLVSASNGIISISVIHDTKSGSSIVEKPKKTVNYNR